MRVHLGDGAFGRHLRISQERATTPAWVSVFVVRFGQFKVEDLALSYEAER